MFVLLVFFLFISMVLMLFMNFWSVIISYGLFLFIWLLKLFEVFILILSLYLLIFFLSIGDGLVKLVDDDFLFLLILSSLFGLIDM